MFFSISGLLICSRLLEEEAVLGRVSLPDFYIRRAFRILPPALLFLLTVALLGAAHLLPFDSSSWLAALLFYRNYWAWIFGADAHTWFTGHFWSLSVEEHFYLLLPAILVFFPRLRRPLLLALTLASFASLAFFTLRPSHPIHEFFEQRTESCLAALLIGALWALSLRSSHVERWSTRLLQPWVGLLCFLLIVGNLFTHLPPGPQNFLLIATRSVLGPIVLLSTLLHPQSLTTRLLESPPFRFIGRISYSLYLWQSLFLTFNFIYPGPLRRLQHPFIGIACTLACAAASYFLVETPLIRLGRRFTRREAELSPQAVTSGSPS